MDLETFTEFKEGTLEPIALGGRDTYAFIPNRLPGKRFDMSGKLWPLVAEAAQAVGSLEQIGGILPNPFLLLGPLQQREALVSTRLEGTYALPENLLLFDVEREDDSAPRRPLTEEGRDSQEVSNHYEALRQGHNWLVKGKPLDRTLVLHLHEVLMQGVRGKDKKPGEFRTRQVAVGHPPRRFIPPPPERVEACLDDLFSYMATGSSPHGLIKSYQVHYHLEAIHPFEDGNGRVGRVLLSLCVARWLKLSMPWLYMSEFFYWNRREYLERLYNVSANGEWEEWLSFCLVGTVKQCRSAIARCNALRNLKDDYSKAALGRGPRDRDIIDMLFETPVVRASQVAMRCGVTSVTARHDLKGLVEAGVLKVLKNTRPKAFACFAIIDAAYGDDPSPPVSDDATSAR